MKHILLTSLVLFLSVESMAAFKAGQIYQLKKTIVFQKVVGYAPQKVSDSKDAVEYSPYVAFWSIDRKKFQKADELAAGLCEIRIVQTASTETAISIKKKSIFKVSTPMRAEQANVQSPNNCVVMDAISEDGGAAEKPQMQFTCCSKSEFSTPASVQEFNERIEKQLRPLMKLEKAK